VFLLVFSINTFSQTDDNTLSRVTLLSGESYTGKIVLQNSEIIMLQLADGTRYQFPVAEISEIKQAVSTKTTSKEDAESKPEPGNICGMLEISGGVARAAGRFDTGLPAQVSISFGIKQIAGLPFFTGVGSGYFFAYNADNKETMGFVPVFIRFKYNKINKPFAPYFLLDAGYSFALVKSYNGGLYAKTSVGIQFNFSEQTAFYMGLFCGFQNFNGSLTDIYDNQPYNYTGNSAIINFGLNFGLQF